MESFPYEKGRGVLCLSDTSTLYVLTLLFFFLSLCSKAAFSLENVKEEWSGKEGSSRRARQFLLTIFQRRDSASSAAPPPPHINHGMLVAPFDVVQGMQHHVEGDRESLQRKAQVGAIRLGFPSTGFPLNLL